MKYGAHWQQAQRIQVCRQIWGVQAIGEMLHSEAERIVVLKASWPRLEAKDNEDNGFLSFFYYYKG
jgi:hypothetical protein